MQLEKPKSAGRSRPLVYHKKINHIHKLDNFDCQKTKSEPEPLGDFFFAEEVLEILENVPMKSFYLVMLVRMWKG